jgi:hypothetical protein
MGNIISTQPENIYGKVKGTMELMQVYEYAKLRTG